MARFAANIAKAYSFRGYHGWDSKGRQYRIKRNRESNGKVTPNVWWCYPACEKGVAIFSARTLEEVSKRLMRGMGSNAGAGEACKTANEQGI